MARKKKTQIVSQTATDSLSYKGTVTVSVMHGKKTISTKKYSNTGYLQLFKFLCECLAGNYDSGTRPCKIVLFGGSDSESTSSPDLSTSKIITSVAIPANSAAVTKKEITGTTSYYVTTYHFTVPYAYINSDADKIYKAALMKETNNLQYSSYADELCASYMFTKTVDGVTSWDPVSLTRTAGNYSLIIEWELAIKN